MSHDPARKAWKTEEVEMIRKLMAAGITTREIGKLFKVTRGAIIGVANRHDISKDRPHHELGATRFLIEQSLTVRSIADTYALFACTISPPVSRRQIERVANEMAPEEKFKPAKKTRGAAPAPTRSVEIQLAESGSDALRDRCMDMYAKTANKRGCSLEEAMLRTLYPAAAVEAWRAAA